MHLLEKWLRSEYRTPGPRPGSLSKNNLHHDETHGAPPFSFQYMALRLSCVKKYPGGPYVLRDIPVTFCVLSIPERVLTPRKGEDNFGDGFSGSSPDAKLPKPHSPFLLYGCSPQNGSPPNKDETR